MYIVQEVIGASTKSAS